jgi:muramoyltetrapeptide carboxypeptidase
MTPRTRAGLVKFRPLPPGGRIALVAPASPFERAEFDAGVAELRRLGYDVVFDPDVFSREGFVAGSPAVRAGALQRALAASDVDAVMAVRGGYGSVQILPLLEPDAVRASRTALVGYSDVTSLHVYFGCVAGLASVHGPMLEGRLARGASGYDAVSLQASLGTRALGELAQEGVDVVRPGEAAGPLFGGTISQLLGSLATPYAFDPPAGHVLFLDEVGERPYRLHRMLVQLQQSGCLRRAAAVVFGELPRCDEPGGTATGRDVVREVLADFPGPVLLGFPSGHTTTPLVSLPLGVETRVVTAGAPRLVVEEAAAA